MYGQWALLPDSECLMSKNVNVRMEVHYRESCLRVTILNRVFRLACIIVRGAVVERVDNKLAGSWLVERFSPVYGII